MNKSAFLFATSACALLSACGGGSTSATDANGIQTGPLSGAEIERTINGVANATGTGVSFDELVAIGDAASTFDSEDLSPRDLTASGSATYTGVVLLADFDTSDLFDLLTTDSTIDAAIDETAPDPTFAMLGRSQLRVTFGEDPAVSGGANGFIGLNGETLLATEEFADVGENPDLQTIIDALPTVNVPGSLTYSGGSIFDIDPETDSIDDLGLGFDVTGSLTLTSALTGQSSSQTLNVDGQGIAAMTDTFGVGLLDLGATGGGNSIPIGGVVIGVADD